MDLIHFSRRKVRSVGSVCQVHERVYYSPHSKPVGLWVSDESTEDGWVSWCRREEMADWLDGTVGYRVHLHPDHRVLVIRSVDQLDRFARDFGAPSTHGSRPAIMWDAVAWHWQGVIITPYQWERRLDPRASWYYSWDCASGCIWDAAAVASIEPVGMACEADG